MLDSGRLDSGSRSEAARRAGTALRSPSCYVRSITGKYVESQLQRAAGQFRWVGSASPAREWLRLRLILTKSLETEPVAHMPIGELAPLVPRLKKIWADAAYRGKELADWCKQHNGWALEVVEREADTRGFNI